MQIFTGNSVAQSAIKDAAESRAPAQITGENDFKSILQNNIVTALQFSRHANTRLGARDIKLSSEQLKRVEGAISKAEVKGIRDSLVLVDDIALVVNIKSKMVITAMDQRSDNIFTNIDGAVIV